MYDEIKMPMFGASLEFPNAIVIFSKKLEIEFKTLKLTLNDPGEYNSKYRIPDLFYLFARKKSALFLRYDKMKLKTFNNLYMVEENFINCSYTI